jgi:hypothetical protein
VPRAYGLTTEHIWPSIAEWLSSRSYSSLLIVILMFMALSIRSIFSVLSICFLVTNTTHYLSRISKRISGERRDLFLILCAYLLCKTHQKDHICRRFAEKNTPCNPYKI